MREYFEHKTVWLTLIIVVAVMLAIFMFSAQTEEESSETSGYFVDFFINLFSPDFENLPTENQEAALTRVTNLIRKLAHFTEYTVLGFCLALHIGELKSKLNKKLGFEWAAVVGVLYAVSDELHQFFVPGRGPGAKDVLIDSLGVLTGLALMLAIMSLIKRRSAADKKA